MVDAKPGICSEPHFTEIKSFKKKKTTNQKKPQTTKKTPKKLHYYKLRLNNI